MSLRVEVFRVSGSGVPMRLTTRVTMEVALRATTILGFVFSLAVYVWDRVSAMFMGLVGTCSDLYRLKVSAFSA